MDLVRARPWPRPPRCSPRPTRGWCRTSCSRVAGSAPWDGLSPRSWRDRTARTVTRVDADAAGRRRKERRAARSVRSAPTGDGMAELIIDTDAADVAMTEQVLTDLAHARDDHTEDGEYVHDGPAPGRRVRRGVPPDPGRATRTRGPGAPGTRARAGGPPGHLLRDRPGRPGPRGGPRPARASLPGPGHHP